MRYCALGGRVGRSLDVRVADEAGERDAGGEVAPGQDALGDLLLSSVVFLVLL